MTIVKLDTCRITDWDTFHDVFAQVFGFPDFYGCSMNAWIDCMTSLGNPADGMSLVHPEEGSTLILQLEEVDDFAVRCPEQYAAIVEGSAFVNWRLIESGHSAVLTLSFYKSPS